MLACSHCGPAAAGRVVRQSLRGISALALPRLQYVRAARARRRGQRLSAGPDPPPGSDKEEKSVLDDLQRFQQRQVSKATAQDASADSMAGFKEIVDKVLIADFFFILAALLWLGLGAAAQSTGLTSGPLDVWLKLWPGVFQPALGVLMLGALVSGVTGSLQQRAQK